MEALGTGIARALVAIVFPARRANAEGQQHVNSTDEENVGPGLHLKIMNPSAPSVRQRHVADHNNQENNDERDGSTSTDTAGALTPSSTEEAPTSPESFAKLPWRRMSTGFGSSLFSGASAESQESQEHIRGHDQFKTETFDDLPRGFPSLAGFVSSDDELSIGRRFNTVHNRLLLHYQVEITELEKQLQKLDKEDQGNRKTAHRLRRTTHKEGWDPRQQELLKELKVKVKEYGDLALNHARWQELRRPSKRNFLQYWNFIWTTQPLADGFWDYAYFADDFVSLSGSHTNYFREFFKDHVFKRRLSPFRWWLRRDDENVPSQNKAAIYYNEKRLNILSQASVLVVAVGMLLIPVNLLFLVPMSHPGMSATVAAFVLLFGFLMLLLTNNIYEILIATATYSAVLIMFLGNLGGSTSCGCATLMA